ncbi:hypothetical protein AALO_G00065020 [Alosa alosa]|uniref:Uncharacterized protein n=1 Tax=Alosa alosa TaxID=278164 RepID=A0AAV6H0Q3_9TELE|nr:hypothetical protein AALO_G00065020 [Alosa alosa]
MEREREREGDKRGSAVLSSSVKLKNRENGTLYVQKYTRFYCVLSVLDHRMCTTKIQLRQSQVRRSGREDEVMWYNTQRGRGGKSSAHDWFISTAEPKWMLSMPRGLFSPLDFPITTPQGLTVCGSSLYL